METQKRTRSAASVVGGWFYLLVVIVMFMGGMFQVNAEEKNKEYDLDMWPFLKLSEDHNVVCWPVYEQDGAFKMIFPFYYKTNQGRESHVFWPIVKFKDGHLERVMPFWFNHDDSFVCLPFLIQNKKMTLWTVPPVYIENDSDFTAAIPFYLKNKNQQFIFPNIYLADKKEYSETALWPIYSNVDSRHDAIPNSFKLLPYKKSWSEKTGYNYQAVYPFYKHEKDPENSSNSLQIGNYFSGKDRASSYKTIFPFYSTGENFADESSYTWFANYFSKDNPKKLEATVFPFSHYEKNKVTGEGKLWCLNYIRKSTTDSSKNTFLPILSYGSDQDSSYFWCMNYYHGVSPEKRQTVFFPMYKYVKSEGKDAVNSLWILPYLREWNESGSISHSAFYPIFSYKRNKDRSSFWCGNYLSRKSENSDSLAVFPFYGKSRKRLHDGYSKESRTIFWPFYERKQRKNPDGKVIASNSRFLFFNNELKTNGKRNLKVFDWVVREQVN